MEGRIRIFAKNFKNVGAIPVKRATIKSQVNSFCHKFAYLHMPVNTPKNVNPTGIHDNHLTTS